jgi:tetratricopeptide (TPR) repeat protein
MSGYLRKLFGQQQASPSTDEESDLEKFYTDSEHARRVFEQMVIAESLPKRILVIHGLGGVGKSTLLKIYALTCRKQHIPSALIASEEAPSPVDVLADWEADLNHDGVSLPTFHKTLTHYRAIQAKVEDEVKKRQQTKSQIVGTLSKTAAKTAISMAASAIPIIGPLVGAVGGESAEAFIDWLRGFLTKPDMDLYLDPAKRLDSDFLSDLVPVAARQRIVLMTDTYEQMTALDDWMRELARRLPKNVLLVIAGRTVPAWDRSWQDWMGKAEIIELKEMTPDDIRTLVHRYYAFIRSGDPDPKQVEAIIQFARGLPMVATTVVQLWVKYGLEEFQTVRPQVVADLVDRLLEGVPPEMRPAFESAAVLRYFNVEALSALLENGNAEALYAELRRWPFIRSRKEGLAVHDTMREMINEALKTRTPERFRSLQERAVAYYETRLEKATGEEQERYWLERLYHLMWLDEVGGIHLFQEKAEELTRASLINQLRTLMNDINTYSQQLVHENSRLWAMYYNTRLMHLMAQQSEALKFYVEIGERQDIDVKLRAYALCDWSQVLSDREFLFQQSSGLITGLAEKAMQISNQSLQVMPIPDEKLILNYRTQSDLSFYVWGNWDKAFDLLRQMQKYYVDRGDNYGQAFALRTIQTLAALRGDWHTMLSAREEGLQKLPMQFERSSLHAELLAWLSPAYARTGRYAEAELNTRQAMSIAKEVGEVDVRGELRDLGVILAFQGKYQESTASIEEALALNARLGHADLDRSATLRFQAISLLRGGNLGEAKQKLEEAIELNARANYKPSMGEVQAWLGLAYELGKDWSSALKCYQHSLEFRGRRYFECAALTGLVRVKYAQSAYDAILPFFEEAAQLAQQYEYNDYFTSLYLTRGHIAWDGLIPEWESGFDTALQFYQLALIHALRFNRFLLDEALSGREQGTPLRPIIPNCLEHGKEGQRMLVALRDCWQSGMNDSGTPRPYTISPIPESISLLEGEQIAREREPGDGSSQIIMVEQINAALSNV